MVSAEGRDELLCLNNSTSASCKTLRYPINNGFTSICMYSTFYNATENIEIVYPNDMITDFNIFCEECSFIRNSVIILSCKGGKICPITFHNLRIESGLIILINVSMRLNNVMLEETVIEGEFNDTESIYNEIHFNNSTLLCYAIRKCGLYLSNISASKVVFEGSIINNFDLVISVNQLMLMITDSCVTLPKIFVNVKSIEYQKVPAIVKFYNITVVKSRWSFLGNGKFEPLDAIVFDIINPWMFIKACNFNGVHLNIQSKRHHFSPLFFSLILENSFFMNSFHIGDGGALKITSEVPSSQVIISDCLFTNNSAIQGLGSFKGQGGGLYVDGISLELIVIDTILKDNKASDSGIALYTTEGVDVSFKNSTLQYVIDKNDPIQQSIMFVNGKISNFHGLFEVSNPSPDSYVGPFNVILYWTRS